MKQGTVTAECRFCHQWEAAAGDTYCSFCGSLLLLLDVTPESHVLISRIGPPKTLKLRNGSARAMRVTIEAREATPPAAVTFAPGPELEIAGGSEAEVVVSVDDALLPPGFSRTIEYAVVVDGDERKQRPFRLEVRSGPKPKLLTPRVDFENVQEGPLDRLVEHRQRAVTHPRGERRRHGAPARGRRLRRSPAQIRREDVDPRRLAELSR